MHVAKIQRRHGDRVYTSHLVRRSIREGRRVRHETIANVSKLPAEAIEALRRALRGEALMPLGEVLRITDSVPAGHAEALLRAARRLGLPRLLDRWPSRERDLCLAMICQRVLEPGSKLATARALRRSTLAAELGVEGAEADDLYGAMDWLSERQGRIEDRLARRHLPEGTLVLYDVSSSYFEGRTCPLAELGYSRDRRPGTLQIAYGLLCDPDGRPIAIEAFAGSLHDDATLPAQLSKLRARFGLSEVVVVFDRGMVTKANLELLRGMEGASWITALKAPQVKRLVKDGHLQPTLFDQQNLAEISDPEGYPGERLVVCRNPLVAEERARKREDLLKATERGLEEIRARVEAGTLRGAAEIGLAVGPVLKRYRVKKHFEVEITDASFAYRRKQAQIEAEAALDGFYVLRTPIPKRKLKAPDVTRSYKQLKWAERAFRTLKGPLEVRPIHHRLEDRVRAHLFLCMLSYYLEWHLRQCWAELTFQDECPPIGADPVAKAKRSAAATRKARRRRTSRGEAPHSFESLLSELGRRTRNTVRLGDSEASFEQLSEANELQARALELVEEIPQHA
ncbi:MAG: IS1634 family transposase [Thermoanaerobaculia bacterium]